MFPKNFISLNAHPHKWFGQFPRRSLQCLFILMAATAHILDLNELFDMRARNTEHASIVQSHSAKFTLVFDSLCSNLFPIDYYQKLPGLLLQTQNV